MNETLKVLITFSSFYSDQIFLYSIIPDSFLLRQSYLFCYFSPPLYFTWFYFCCCCFVWLLTHAVKNSSLGRLTSPSLSNFVLPVEPINSRTIFLILWVFFNDFFNMHMPVAGTILQYADFAACACAVRPWVTLQLSMTTHWVSVHQPVAFLYFLMWVYLH